MILDLRDEAEIDIMMMAFVAAFAAIGFRQLDLAVLDAIDGTDMNAVRRRSFHMLLDATVGHGELLVLVVDAMRSVAPAHGFRRVISSALLRRTVRVPLPARRWSPPSDRVRAAEYAAAVARPGRAGSL